MSQSRIVVYVDERDEPYVRKAVQRALDAFAVPGTYNLTVEPVIEKQPSASTDAPAKSA